MTRPQEKQQPNLGNEALAVGFPKKPVVVREGALLSRMRTVVGVPIGSTDTRAGSGGSSNTRTGSGGSPLGNGTAGQEKDDSAVRAELAALLREAKRQKEELDSIQLVSESYVALSELKAATEPVQTVQLSGDPPDSDVPQNQKAVSFFPEMAKSLVADSLTTINEVGELLKSNPSVGLVIRGYSASPDEKSGMMVISESRARYCASYLHDVFDIPYSRMTIEWYRKSEAMEETEPEELDATLRKVDLITRLDSTKKDALAWASVK
jgi:outer membrane protein OmpA-like peptidoglycan-associated protein